MSRFLTLFAVATLLLAGCPADQEPTYVLASSYDQSCTSGDECVPVTQDACLACNSCSNWDAAINEGAEAEFEADKSGIYCESESTAGCNNGCDGSRRAICINRRCTLWDGGSGLIPRSCANDEQCIAISTVEATRCYPTSCPDVAANQASYESAVGIDCSDQVDEGGPNADECPRPVTARCIDGACILAN